MGTWELLQRTPIDELRRRAAIVDQWIDIGPVEVPGGTRYAWHDGSGQSAGWFFAETGQVLLLTFEHESLLNFYDVNGGNYAAQREVFGGVPAELTALVANQPESYEFLNVTDKNTGNTLPHASGMFWFDGASWHIAPGLATYCERDGIDLFEESNFEYCTSTYLLDRAFTPEALIAERIAHAWHTEADLRPDAVERLRAIFDSQGGR